MPRLAPVIAVWLTLAAGTFAQTVPAPAPPSILAYGDSTIRIAPDRAWISIGAEVRDGKAVTARQKCADAMTAVQHALKDVGVPADAIRTMGYAVEPEMDYDSSHVKDYVVRNQISVRVDDLDRISDVLDAANTPKNVALSIDGPRFDLKNRDAAETDAVRQATETAMARATAAAGGAHQSLGAVLRLEVQNVSVTNASGPNPQPVFRAMAAGGGGGRGGAAAPVIDTPISAGEMVVSARVALTVEIH
jgi:uncharacterized protein YggE